MPTAAQPLSKNIRDSVVLIKTRNNQMKCDRIVRQTSLNKHTNKKPIDTHRLLLFINNMTNNLVPIFILPMW